MRETVSGMMISVSEGQNENASSRISVIPSHKTTFLRFLHPEKAQAEIFFKLFGR